MKTNWIGILLVVVLLSLCSIAFLKGAKNSTEILYEDDPVAKSSTEMPYADEPVVKVEEAEQPATAQDIQKHNERLIKFFTSRHGSDLINKDIVDMNKPIKNISGGLGQNKSVIRIRYEDGSFDQYTVDNK